MSVVEPKSSDPGHDYFQKSKRGCFSVGCYNKKPQTRVLLNNRNLFLEVGSPRSACQHGWFLVKALFWDADCPHLAVFSHGRRGRDLSESFYKGTNPIHEGCPCDLVTSQRLPSSYHYLGH